MEEKNKAEVSYKLGFLEKQNSTAKNLLSSVIFLEVV